MILNLWQENEITELQNYANYDVGNKIVYNTEVLKSNICDYNDAYILMIDDTTIIGHHVIQVSFKNCAPAAKYIAKFDWITINDAEDLDLVMSMHNLIKYSSNYSETTGSLWFYAKD